MDAGLTRVSLICMSLKQMMENCFIKYTPSRHHRLIFLIWICSCLRWTGVKDITKLVSMPGSSRQACVGVIDSEKGAIVDIINK